MDKIKNYVIAILTGLLALSLFTQPAQSAAVKTYDAVKLVQYDRCLELTNISKNNFGMLNTPRTDLAMNEVLAACAYLKP